tara:strand:+ start:2061 stop:2504 length:444 start_codon:yes stop_codon:yes gene_type:complete
MRATIKFELEVSQVNRVMLSLVREESKNLEDIVDLLQSISPEQLVSGLGETIERMGEALQQFEQYRDMVASFEQAKLSTVLPQPASTPAFQVEAKPTASGAQSPAVNSLRDVEAATAIMGQFDAFVDRMNNQGKEQEDGEKNEPEEG